MIWVQSYISTHLIVAYLDISIYVKEYDKSNLTKTYVRTSSFFNDMNGFSFVEWIIAFEYLRYIFNFCAIHYEMVAIFNLIYIANIFFIHLTRPPTKL